MRYFVFLTLEDKIFSNLLDIAIYALNPQEKWGAHVTLAGPYSDPRKIPKKLEFEKKISVVGPGQFRSENQNTVFLKVGTDDLRSVWNKPDFPYNPHLTLYDGLDHELGDALFRELTLFRPYMKFYVSKLHVVQSIKGQQALDFLPNIDLSVLFSTKRMKIADLKTLNRAQKVKIAIEAIAKAKSYSQSLR